MTAPKPLEARPLDVECPKCGAWVGENCSPVTRLGFVHITGRAKPHAARLRRAAPARRRGEGTVRADVIHADCPSCSNLRSQNTALCDLLVQEADALHNVREYALECSDRAGGALDPATVSARLWAIVAGLPLPVRPCPVCVARRAQCQMVTDTILGLADLQRAPL